MTFFLFAGALMGILVGVINYIYWSLGFPADFGGIGGMKIVVAFSIPLFVLLALVGGVLGSNEKNNETLNKTLQSDADKLRR